MKCKETLKVLSRYLDRELSPTAVAPVEQHLTQCTACRAELFRQRRVWELVGHERAVEPPDVVASVQARLAAPQGRSALFESLRLRSIGFATAGAVLVGLFVWTGVWAGAARRGTGLPEHDPTFAEFLNDAPPGMEVVAVLDQIGEQP
jgi:predicted anti-sigma-YlaC factor YlaD